MESSAAASRIPAFISSLRSNRHHSLLPIPFRISLPRAIALRAPTLTAAVRSQSTAAVSDPSPMGSQSRLQSQSFFRSALANMEKVYMSRNPTAKSVLELVSSSDGSPVCYDHFAFRTFGVDGHGIDSIANFFLDFGYVQREELRFPAKKLRALWFAPPEIEYSGSGRSPLPRIFISELLVDAMSSQSQEIIRKYVKMSGNGNKYAALASTLGCLTWEKPVYSDYRQLSRESEYAAWTLVNGYAVNHVTISVHRLKSHIRSIKTLNQFIEDHGYKLNSEGGTLKVSPDGLLLQSSTVADSTLLNFADGVTESVPCSYTEFAERLILPQYEKLANEEVLEANERKVGKVRFKPINNGSPDVETKDLNRFLSTKVVKRKKKREMESGSNGVQIAKRVEEDRYLDDRSYHDRMEGYGIVEKGDGYDSNSQP